MGALPINRISVEEYLAFDRESEVRNEYDDGEMFPVVSASVAHSLLQFNLGRRLAERINGSGCRVAGASLRVRVGPSKYVYPDVLVYCGKAELADKHEDTLANPKVIVEVLSPSTENYDYGRKFSYYRSLPSLEEYLLVSQEQPRVEIYHKIPQNRWLLSTYDGLDTTVHVESLGISIPMAELYEGVELSPASD